MSKAEDLAAKLVIPKQVDDIEELCRFYYIIGYNQAEKDLELTWEDMMIIHKCCKDAMNLNLYAWETAEGQKKIYEDVLKRFKEKKEK